MSSLYKPLGSSPAQFRLLKVIGLKDGVPECELHVVSHPLLYNALSYRWGDEEATVPIKLNGQEFMTRLMLYQFLKQLGEDHHQDRLIFVDAICINQSDTVERSTQVRLMGDIYKFAENVIVWIPLEPSLLEAWTFVNEELFWRQQLKSQVANYWLSWRYWRHRVDAWKSQVKYGRTTRRLRTELKDSIAIAVSYDLFWSRLWIMQEVLLARQLHVRIGPTQFDETSLAAISLIGREKESLSLLTLMTSAVSRSYADHLHINHDPMLPVKMSYYQSVTLQKLRILVGSELRAGLLLPFYMAIILSCTHECYLVHDKVFGISGITNISIIPDYDMALGDLFADTVAECIISWAVRSPIDGKTPFEWFQVSPELVHPFENVGLASYPCVLVIFKLVITNTLALLAFNEVMTCCAPLINRLDVLSCLIAQHDFGTIISDRSKAAEVLARWPKEEPSPGQNRNGEPRMWLIGEPERKIATAKQDNTLIKAPWNTPAGEADERRYEDWVQHIRERTKALQARKANDM